MESHVPNRLVRRPTMQTLNTMDRSVQNSRPPSIEGSPSASEVVLLERCKAGESTAWNTLIRKYEKSVYKFAYSLCRNHEEAGDIAGQVFLRLYQNLHTFRPTSARCCGCTIPRASRTRRSRRRRDSRSARLSPA